MEELTAILKVQADDFSIIEQHLKDYHIYVSGLKNLKAQYNRLFPKVTTAFRLSEGSSGTMNFKSTTEDFAIERAELSEAIQREILQYDNIISSIENALSALDEKELQFVEYRYFKGWTIEQIMPKLGYSRRGIYGVRDKVKAKFLINLRNLLIY